MENPHKHNLIVKIWLPIAVVTTVLAALIYVAVQQNYRMSANDPQIELAESTADALSNGTPASAISPSSQTDLAKSLSTFIIVYDDTGKELASSIQLNGKTPALPSGVLDATRKSGESRITWQPAKGVRSAVVISHYKSQGQSGFILVGRSLREIEKRIQQLTIMVAVAWAVTLILSLLTILLIQICALKNPADVTVANTTTATEPVK